MSTRSAAVAVPGGPPGEPCPLAELNAYIRERRAARTGAALPGEAVDPDELLSVRRFRQSFERGLTLDRIEQALSRAPAQAGPLNSHALVLRTLDAMRELSPDYLRRFLLQAETLLWLERAKAQYPREQAKGSRPKAQYPREQAKGSRPKADRSRKRK